MSTLRGPLQSGGPSQRRLTAVQAWIKTKVAIAMSSETQKIDVVCDQIDLVVDFELLAGGHGEWHPCLLVAAERTAIVEL